MINLNIKAKKEDPNDWRKCIICGRYVSYDDLNNGKAIVNQEFNIWLEDPADAILQAEHTYKCLELKR